MRKDANFWSKEQCHSVASQYKNLSEFKKRNDYVYVKSLKNGWLDDICSHMNFDVKKRGYWTKSRCIEISFTCENRDEFRKKYKSAYTACTRNNWLDNIIGTSKKLLREYWTKERCHNEALKYKYQRNFKYESSIAYSRARHNNWLTDICSHMKSLGTKYKRCIYVFEFSDNCAYIGLTYDYEKRLHQHLTKNNSSVNKHIQTNPTVNYTTKKLSDYIDIPTAKNLENKTLNEYKKDGWTILNKIKTGGIGGKRMWTKEKCQIEASKFQSKKEFRICSGGAFGRAYKDGFLNEICSHMK